MHSTQRALGADTTHYLGQNTETKPLVKEIYAEAGCTPRRSIKSTPFELCSLISYVRLPPGSQQLKTCHSTPMSSYLSISLSSHVHCNNQRAQHKTTRLEMTTQRSPRADAPRCLGQSTKETKPMTKRETLRLAVSLLSLQGLLLNPVRTPHPSAASISRQPARSTAMSSHPQCTAAGRAEQSTAEDNASGDDKNKGVLRLTPHTALNETTKRLC
jgi:hypothetical protein